MKFADLDILNIQVENKELLKILPYQNVNITDTDKTKTKIVFKIVDYIDTVNFKSVMGSCFYNKDSFIVTIQGRKISTVFNAQSNTVECFIEKSNKYIFASEYLNGLIRVISLKNDNLFLHSSTTIDDTETANIFVSWASSGKTRFMLALKSLKHEILTDEWTIFNKNGLYPTKNDLCLMWYDVKLFPTIFDIDKLSKLSMTMFEKIPSGYFKRLLLKIGLIKPHIFVPASLAFVNRSKVFNNKRFILIENSVTGFSFKKIKDKKEFYKYLSIFKRENWEFIYYLNIFEYCFPNHWLNQIWIEDKLKDIIESNMNDNEIYKIYVPVEYTQDELIFFCEKLINEF